MKRIFLLVVLIGSLCQAEDKEEEVKEGNLALPTSQQPGPLFAFGQTIVDKGDILAYFTLDDQLGKHKKYIDIFPAFIYGVTDSFALYGSIPFTPKYMECKDKSSGIEDIFLQGEYLFYKKESPRDALWATVVGALFVPTGSIKKDPPTGFGGPNFLLGATLAYWSVEWYWFLSPFAHLNTAKSGTKFGNQFYYQGGVGRNLVGNPDGWIVTPMIELYGVFSQKDKVSGVIDCDSGGNTVWVGPSMWTATKRFIGQAGILFPLAQHLNGKQNKDRYIFGVNFAWKFNG